MKEMNEKKWNRLTNGLKEVNARTEEHGWRSRRRRKEWIWRCNVKIITIEDKIEKGEESKKEEYKD